MLARFVGAVLVAFASTASVAAHHSYAAIYRQDERITIDGVLMTIVYRNPHSYLEVKAPDASGRMRLWSVECGSHIDLERRSFTKGTLKPGDRLIVSGDAARDPSVRRLRLRTLKRPSDGWHWTEQTEQPNGEGPRSKQ